MRIFLDSSALVQPGFDRGLGRYTQALIKASTKPNGIPIEKANSINRVTSKIEVNQESQIGLHVSPDRNDIYHSTSPANLPFLKKSKWVCSILDLIPIDLKEYQRLGILTRANYLNALRADAILVLSSFTKLRLIEKYNVPPDKIWVHGLPLHANFNSNFDARSNFKKKSSFIFSLVDMRVKDPRKRIHWINQVFLKLNECGISTVIAGRGIPKEYFPNSEIIENPSDKVLLELYLNASGFYYPSAYEGQGMPPIEALSQGCPVVAYNNTSIPEMLGNRAVILEDRHPWQKSLLTEPLEPWEVAHVVEIFKQWVSMPKVEFDNFRTNLIRNSTFITDESFSKFLNEIYESLQ